MKKGFTLVELMATIVILSIISVIGIGVYQKSQKNIKEQEYKNKINYIETQAALFASETGYMSTNVEYLVNTGYIEADNDRGEVISPKDQKVLNDYVVVITKEGDNYYGSLTDKEESNLANIDMINENLEIVVTTESGKILENNEWTNENIILSTNIKKENIDTNTITKIKWFNNVTTKEIDVNKNYAEVNSYVAEVSQILDTEFQVEIIFEDGSKFDAKRTIKVDKQKPILYENEVRVENAESWTNSAKKINYLATDQTGSGIYGYMISENPIAQCSTNKSEYTQSGEVFSIEKYQGNYYTCIIDNVGNTSQVVSTRVEKTDVNPPIIEDFVEDMIDAYENLSTYKYVKLRNQAYDNTSSNESGLKQINYCISMTNSPCDPKNTIQLKDGEFAYYELNEENPNMQMFCATAQDAAGNISEVKCSKQYLIKKKLFVADAGEMCKPDKNHYCNTGVYLKYGNYVFTLYKVEGNSVYGYTKVGDIHLIQAGCCDSGYCKPEYVYSNVGIYASLETYYNQLPSSRETVLNKENYSFGSITSEQFANATDMTSAYSSTNNLLAKYGLLNIIEYQYLRSKTYASISTLLSTIRYDQGGLINAIYATPSGYQAVSPLIGNERTTYMSVPFNKDVLIQSGSGSLSDPFIIE